MRGKVREDRNGPSANILAQPNLLEDLSRIYLSDYSQLCRFAVRMVCSSHAAEDVVQNAYLKTVVAVQRGAQIRDIAGWLRTCVRNEALMHIRGQRWLKLEGNQAAHDGEGPAEREPAQVSQLRDTCAQIYETIGDLPAKQRAALVLAELHGLNYKEIAAKLGRSEKAIHGLLQRARSRVRATVDAELVPVALPTLATHSRYADLHSHTGRKQAADWLGRWISEAQNGTASLAERASNHLTQALQPAAALIATTLAVLAPEPAASDRPGQVVPPEKAAAEYVSATGDSGAADSGGRGERSDPRSGGGRPGESPTATGDTHESDPPGSNRDRVQGSNRQHPAGSAAPAASANGKLPTVPVADSHGDAVQQQNDLAKTPNPLSPIGGIDGGGGSGGSGGGGQTGGGGGTDSGNGSDGSDEAGGGPPCITVAECDPGPPKIPDPTR